MHGLIFLLLLCAISSAMPAKFCGGAFLSDTVSTDDISPKLKKVWLRFHEADLCQGVDAEFIFNKNGMEIRSRIEDEKSYQKLLELIAPLNDSFKIELHPTWPPEEEKIDNDGDPYPSLWQNYALRASLGDPVARAIENNESDADEIMRSIPWDSMLKNQLRIFGDQILKWNKKMERYAADLPALARTASDSAEAPEIRSQARAVCVAHAQNLEKCTWKLYSNLVQAFPGGLKGDRQLARREEDAPAEKAKPESAETLSVMVRDVARRVSGFIHPEHFTVGLDELRQPSLLQSLRILKKAADNFQKSMNRVRPK